MDDHFHTPQACLSPRNHHSKKEQSLPISSFASVKSKRVERKTPPPVTGSILSEVYFTLSKVCYVAVLLACCSLGSLLFTFWVGVQDFYVS